MINEKILWKAAWVRACRSFFQAIGISIPVGFVVTPMMLQNFNIEYIYTILALIINAALYALASFITCIVGGLPEVDYQQALEQLAELRPQPVVDEEEEDGSAD